MGPSTFHAEPAERDEHAPATQASAKTSASCTQTDAAEWPLIAALRQQARPRYQMTWLLRLRAAARGPVRPATGRPGGFESVQPGDWPAQAVRGPHRFACQPAPG